MLGSSSGQELRSEGRLSSPSTLPEVRAERRPPESCVSPGGGQPTHSASGFRPGKAPVQDCLCREQGRLEAM